MKTRFISIILFLMLSSTSLTSLADEKKTPPPAWVCSFSLLKYSLKSTNNHQIHRPGGKIAFGYRSSHVFWNWTATLDLHIGPFDHAKATNLAVDYKGYGASFWLGINRTFRSFSPIIGLSYIWIEGISLDEASFKIVQDNNLTPDQIINQYSLHIKNLSLSPGFRYIIVDSQESTIQKKPKTSIHEISLQINYAVSLYSSYKSSYTKSENNGSTTSPVSEKASLSGNYYFLSLNILFS